MHGVNLERQKKKKKKKKKKDVHMFFFPFLCSGIPDLALGILKMLLSVYFCDVLQLTDC